MDYSLRFQDIESQESAGISVIELLRLFLSVAVVIVVDAKESLRHLENSIKLKGSTFYH